MESSWPVQACNGIALPLPFFSNYPSSGLQELNKLTVGELMSTGIYVHINTKHSNIIILGMSCLTVSTNLDITSWFCSLKVTAVLMCLRNVLLLHK
jgi:hypothetical protein